MPDLKVYVDLMSQPSRAILLFLKKNEIDYEEKQISIRDGEHKSEDYIKNVHPFGKVPAINDSGFKLIESVAILRYLARKYDVPDHWYPKDIQGQAKVDEFLEWQHIGLRSPLGMFFVTKVVIPILTKNPPNEKEVDAWKLKMEAALDELENVWLKENPYVTGDKISIADLIALCEVDEPRAAGYDAAHGRPKVSAWLNRLRKELHPHYDEVTVVLKKYIRSSLKSRFEQ